MSLRQPFKTEVRVPPALSPAGVHRFEEREGQVHLRPGGKIVKVGAKFHDLGRLERLRELVREDAREAARFYGVTGESSLVVLAVIVKRVYTKVAVGVEQDPFTGRDRTRYREETFQEVEPYAVEEVAWASDGREAAHLEELRGKRAPIL